MDPRFDAAEQAFATNRLEEGLALLGQAIAEAGAAAPVEGFRRLAAVLIGVGRFEPALQACEAGVRLHPDDFDLWNMLGVVQRRLGSFQPALKALDQALRIRPNAAVTLFNKVNVYNDLGEGAPALEIALDLVERNPGNADCRRVAGLAYRNLHDWDRARDMLDAALELQPASMAAWIDRIALATELQQHEEALALLDRAMAALPGSSKLLESRSILLRRAGRATEAEGFLQALLAGDDTVAWAHHQLGRIIVDADRPRANEHLRRAVALDPANAEYRMSLIQSLARSQFGDEGANTQEAYELLCDLRRRGPVPADQLFVARGLYLSVGDYDGLDGFGSFADLGRAWARAGEHTAFLTHLARVRTPQDRHELIEQHRLWGRTVQAVADRNPVKRPQGPRRPGKLRLGLMSSDLRNHIAGLFVLPLFDFFDDERFELYCYSFSRKPEDSYQKYFAAKAKAFRWIPEISDRDAAQMIADDDLDMLIELGGSTHMNKLEVMAYRPARLQASWLGYPHSAGLEAIDYIVVDPYLKPTDLSMLVEKPMVMPHTWVVMGDKQFRDEPEVNPATPEERKGYVTFGTFNQPNKYGPEMLQTWARVLAAVPDSRFLFVRPEGGAPAFRDNMRRRFAAEGVAPERIEFQPIRGAHLPFYDEIDISLDTFPLTGGTTTCESLWMGVPVVSLVGEALFERLSYSILSNAGLGDLAADSRDGFVATAVALAADHARRMTLRITLRDQLRASPLAQGQAFAKDFYDLVAATVALAA